MAPCPTGAWEGSMANYNNRIYFTGGEGFTNLLRIYDIATNTWTTGASLPVGVMQHKVVSDNNGSLYVFGGRLASTTATNSVQKYNIATDTWSVVSTIPVQKNQFGAVLGPNGLIYLIAGKDNYGNNSGPFFSDVQVYNPCSNTWTTAPSHPVAHGELAAATVSNGIYAMGGTNGSGLTQNYFLPVAPGSLSYPSLTVTPASGQICANTQVTVAVSGANTYTWNTSSNSSSIVVTPTANISYTVSGTNTVGCTSTIVKNFTVNPLPTVTATASSATVCAGSNVTLTAGGANTYSWSNNSTGSVTIVTPVVDTAFTVEGTSTAGCKNSVNVSINVNPLPNLTINTSNTVLCIGSTATLTAGGANTYTWSTASNNSVLAVSPTVTTTYTLNGTNTSNGCSATATITQVVSSCTGINELTGNKMMVSAYPNPNNGEFQLQSSEACLLNLYNATGQLQRVIELNQSNNYRVTVDGLASGVYFIGNSNKTVQIKIVVTK